jgi:hypothetical protein
MKIKLYFQVMMSRVERTTVWIISFLYEYQLRLQYDLKNNLSYMVPRGISRGRSVCLHTVTQIFLVAISTMSDEMSSLSQDIQSPHGAIRPTKFDGKWTLKSIFTVSLSLGAINVICASEIIACRAWWSLDGHKCSITKKLNHNQCLVQYLEHTYV